MRIWNGRSQFSLELAGIGHKVKFRDGGGLEGKWCKVCRQMGIKAYGAPSPVFWNLKPVRKLIIEN